MTTTSSAAQNVMAAVQVSPGSHVPLYLQIESRLRELIHEGQYEPLAQLPSETELAVHFGVSRMTARKAVDELVHAGLVFRQAGKGTFVAAPKIARSVFSTQHSFAASIAALGLHSTTKVLHAGMAPAPNVAAEALQLEVGEPAVHINRLRFVEDEPAGLHTAYLPASYASLLDADLTGSLTEEMIAQGADVDRTSDAVEATLATSEIARLLSVAENHPIIRIEGTTYSADGRPIRYTEALFRGDRFRMVLDSRRTPGGEIQIVPHG